MRAWQCGLNFYKKPYMTSSKKFIPKKKKMSGDIILRNFYVKFYEDRSGSFLWIALHTRTHTHTHIYISLFAFMCCTDMFSFSLTNSHHLHPRTSIQPLMLQTSFNPNTAWLNATQNRLGSTMQAKRQSINRTSSKPESEKEPIPLYTWLGVLKAFKTGYKVTLTQSYPLVLITSYSQKRNCNPRPICNPCYAEPN